MTCYYINGSYSPQKKIGVAGFMVNGIVTLSVLEKIKEKNTQCEYLAVKMAIKHAIKEGDVNIKIFTRCSEIITTISKNKNDKYPELFMLLDEFDGNIEWIKVKGHSKKIKKKEDIKFQKIDKAIRKVLRNYARDI